MLVSFSELATFSQFYKKIADIIIFISIESQKDVKIESFQHNSSLIFIFATLWQSDFYKTCQNNGMIKFKKIIYVISLYYKHIVNYAIIETKVEPQE